jgi:peptidoglycan/xylan/chitin deacetylase (PgdA/CDA1 family)
MNVKLPIVTLMFDDGFSSVYSDALPLLEDFGYSANVATIGSKINTPGYLTTEQLKELLSKGWALSDHSYSHINFRRSDPKEIETEISQNRKTIHDLLNYEFTDFVFPKSKVSDLSSGIILSYYPVAFTGTRRLIGNKLPFENRLLKRTEISTYEILSYGLTFSMFVKRLQKYLIEQHKENRQEWSIFFTHRVVNTPSIFDTSKKTFRQILESIHSTGISVKTTPTIISDIRVS